MKILSTNETLEMLGTKEEFEKTIKCEFCGQDMEAEEKSENYHICPPEFELNQRIDEDGDDLMEENNKLDLMESQLADCEEFNN